MVQNPNRVIGAVHFDVTTAEAVGYTLQTNSTVGNPCKTLLPALLFLFAGQHAWVSLHANLYLHTSIFSCCGVTTAQTIAACCCAEASKLLDCTFDLWLMLAAKVLQGEVPGHKYICEAASANGH